MQTGMVRPDNDFGRDYGLIHEAVVTGRKAGAGREFWAKLAHDKTLFERVVAFVRRVDFVGTTHKRAAEIMGPGFFGVAEAIAKYGVNPTRDQLATLSEVPFSEAELLDKRDTHKLVAVFPLSILEIRSQVGAKSFYDQTWYNNESFAKDRGETSWQLVRKTQVPNSTSKNWQEQQALLGRNEETPTARAMVYMVIGHFFVTGERLFQNVYVRCSDVLANGSRVSVGHFDSIGLHVGSYLDHRRYSSLGVSSDQTFN